MHHSEDFLRALAGEQVVGNFPPFSGGNFEEVEDYIRRIAGRLRDNPHVLVEPDFSHYGSGFASYTNIRISKRDHSDSKITTVENRVTKSTEGLLLYLCNLSPYWYYGGSEWSETTENGAFRSGSSGFLSPKSIADYDAAVWERDLGKIKAVLDTYGYSLLTQAEVEKELDFKVALRSNLLDGAPTVFDCFFHWED